MSPVIDWLNSCLKDIDHDDFKYVAKVSGEIQPMGDGQTVVISDIKRVILTLETTDGKKKILKTVIKEEPTTEAGMQMSKNFGSSEGETLVYSKILKCMKKILSEVGDQELIWPECYHCSDNKFVLEDLCESGYKIVPAHELLDLPHALLVMKGIGKYHGLSMVMKERGLLDTSQLNDPFFVKKDPVTDTALNSISENLGKTIRESWSPEWQPVAERLKNFMTDPSEKINQAWKSTRGKWDVLNHGDFNMRNMLFHYKPDSTQPDSVKFIDFQMPHYSNLGFDIGTLLYGSMFRSIREDNKHKLLTTYSDSLAATCKQHNYGGPIPSVDDVILSLKSLNHYTTPISLFHVPFFLNSAKQDLQKKTEEFLANVSSAESAGKGSQNSCNLVDYTDKDIESLIKSELTRCMNENIF